MTKINGAGPMTNDPLLRVEHLEVVAPNGDAIVEDVSFNLAPGECLGVVGESGSGKTTASLALLGYTQGGAEVTNGSVTIAGQRIDASSSTASLRALRGKLVSYVPQNPGSALNPSMRVGQAIQEMLVAHRSGRLAEDVVASALETVHLSGETSFQRRYPHQLSGGQQQRVCISIALVCEPPLVLLDEPTTGLDVVTQARILEELLRLQREQGLSMVYVTHDLAVVAQIATRIAVMYAGRIVEEGPAGEILRRPRHPYTQGLLTSIPDHLRPRVLEPLRGVSVGVGERPQGCSFAPRCDLRTPECEAAMPALRDLGGRSVRCIHAEQVVPAEPPRAAARRVDAAGNAPVLSVNHLRAEHRSRDETVVAAEDVSFELARGTCVALVGESGSGKTTIARTVVGLHDLAAGEIRLGDQLLPPAIRDRSVEQRRRVQMVFQNPADALNPRHTVRQAISRPARLLRGLSRADADAEVERQLELVRLPSRLADRYPGELSGGERQRVGIARALVAEPDVLVCDEVTSALDVSVQAAVLELLDGLRRDLGLALLFITHDLGVVATIADHVVVLEHGKVAEAGPVADLLEHAQHPYTQRLLESAPSISQAVRDWDEFEARGGVLM